MCPAQYLPALQLSSGIAGIAAAILLLVPAWRSWPARRHAAMLQHLEKNFERPELLEEQLKSSHISLMEALRIERRFMMSGAAALLLSFSLLVLDALCR